MFLKEQLLEWQDVSLTVALNRQVNKPVVPPLGAGYWGKCFEC